LVSKTTGPMLWSRSSAIFTYSRQKCRRFSRKPMKSFFLHKWVFTGSKSQIYFRDFFRLKYYPQHRSPHPAITAVTYA
jgi:hypothetical protein